MIISNNNSMVYNTVETLVALCKKKYYCPTFRMSFKRDPTVTVATRFAYLQK